MKKLNLNIFQILKYSQIAIIVANFVALFYLYLFFNKYIYKSFVVDQSYLEAQSHKILRGIDIEKLEIAEKNLKEKMQKK